MASLPDQKPQRLGLEFQSFADRMPLRKPVLATNRDNVEQGLPNPFHHSWSYYIRGALPLPTEQTTLRRDITCGIRPKLRTFESVQCGISCTPHCNNAGSKQISSCTDGF